MILRPSLCCSAGSCSSTASRQGSNAVETLVEVPGDAAVEPDRGARDALEQPAVVADQDDTGAHPCQLALQPLDTGQVEMVGRLVQQQDIGRGGQHAG